MTGKSLRYFSKEIPLSPREKPAWAEAVSRWHQLDAASFGLVSAVHGWLEVVKKPSFIILASPQASNEADDEFVKLGANSPSKMIHTLPSSRASPLCQMMNWSGPLLCIQKDPWTLKAGIAEACHLLSSEYPDIWVLGIAKNSDGKYLASLMEVSRAEKNVFHRIPVSLLEDALPHRPPMRWISEVFRADDTEGECRVLLSEEGHACDASGVRSSSFVEWMAQGYGFVRACRTLIEGPYSVKPEKTYLAAINDIEIYPEAADCDPQGEPPTVHVQTVRELGPLFLIQAEVRGGKTILARGNLKVYGL